MDKAKNEFEYLKSDEELNNYIIDILSVNKKYANYKYPQKNKYDLSGEYGIGYTVNTNEPFYFDKELFDVISKFTWKARHRNDRQSDSYYIEHKFRYQGKFKRVHLHHLVLNIDDRINYKNLKNVVDHVNLKTFDCRKDNLRIGNLRLNNINKNKQKSNTSGIIGVNIIKNKTNISYRARICPSQNKRIVVYKGNNFDEAVKARLNAEYYYYKELSPQKELFDKYGITEKSANNFCKLLKLPKEN